MSASMGGGQLGQSLAADIQSRRLGQRRFQRIGLGAAGRRRQRETTEHRERGSAATVSVHARLFLLQLEIAVVAIAGTEAAVEHAAGD